jgi:hypothetical protein
MLSVSVPSELEWPVNVTGNGGMSAAPSVVPNVVSAAWSVPERSEWPSGKRILPGLSVATWP